MRIFVKYCTNCSHLRHDVKTCYWLENGKGKMWEKVVVRLNFDSVGDGSMILKTRYRNIIVLRESSKRKN